jgi:hypothetical protein
MYSQTTAGSRPGHRMGRRKLRFALGGISCECNGFAAGECSLEYFQQVRVEYSRQPHTRLPTHLPHYG